MKTQSKVKPSQVHQNTELLRQKAEESNRKRQERKIEQERLEQERRVREEEERRIREEEDKMWSEVKKDQPKAEKKSYKQGKIRTKVDGIEFDSLAKAMASIDPVLWGKENDYRTSCWIKINRALKKDGVCIYGGHNYELAQ